MRHEMRILPKHRYAMEDIFDIYRLRAQMHEKKNFCNARFPIDMEIDQYDELDPYYLYVKNEKGIFCSCLRLLPTSGPYMLKDLFPQLLGEMPPPHDRKVWELSRFVVFQNKNICEFDKELAVEIMREIIEFGIEHNVTHFVTAATTSLEQVLMKSGVMVVRLSSAIRINTSYKVGLLIKV